MGNSIAQSQNSESNLEKLAAQRQIYSRVKNIKFIQLILSLGITAGLTFVATISDQIPLLNDINFDAILLLTSILISVLEFLLFTKIAENLQSKAAKIQQLFDIGLFRLTWDDNLIGSKPAYEDISRFSQKYLKHKGAYRDLVNWYPSNIGKVPHFVARAICQRTNVVWDEGLRTEFSNLLVGIGAAMTFTLILIGVLINLDVNGVLTNIVAPLLPLYAFIGSQLKAQIGASNNLKDLQDMSDRSWNLVLQEHPEANALNKISQDIQYRIFINRRDSLPIPNWFYNTSLEAKENIMYYSAEQLMVEYEKTIRETSQSVNSNPSSP